MRKNFGSSENKFTRFKKKKLWNLKKKYCGTLEKNLIKILRNFEKHLRKS